MPKTPRIVVLGSSNTDLVVRAPRIPGRGETVLGREYVMVSGGKGANQAVAAARLGADVAFVGRIGRDAFGDRALDALRAERIDVCGVVRDDAASGVALIVVDEHGENAITVAPGANAALTPEDVNASRGLIEGAAVLLLQLETPLPAVRRAASIARAAGVTVILNPAPARALGDELLAAVNVLTPNEAEARAVATLRPDDETPLGRCAELLRSRGAENVVVTLGPRGALLAAGGPEELIPGIYVRPVDTTGAGDAFNGALAVALAQGRPLPYAVRFAVLASALSVTREGAQTSLPTAEEVDAFALQGG